MKFQIYHRLTLMGRRWFWRLRADNGKIIAQGEPYNRRSDAFQAVALVQTAVIRRSKIEELA